jgi:ribosomal protein L20
MVKQLTGQKQASTKQAMGFYFSSTHTLRQAKPKVRKLMEDMFVGYRKKIRQLAS